MTFDTNKFSLNIYSVDCSMFRFVFCACIETNKDRARNYIGTKSHGQHYVVGILYAIGSESKSLGLQSSIAIEWNIV